MTTRPPNRHPGRERTALFRSPTFREHDTGGHPENAGRLVAIDAALERLGSARRSARYPVHRRARRCAGARPRSSLYRGHTGIRRPGRRLAGRRYRRQSKLGRCRRARRGGRHRRRRRGPRRPGSARFRPCQAPWAPRHPFPGHGILPVQYGGSRRRARARSRPGPSADRRLGRPPWQWHAGRLLRDRSGALLLGPPVAALPRHWGRERARHRPRRGLHHQRAARAGRERRRPTRRSSIRSFFPPPTRSGPRSC